MLACYSHPLSNQLQGTANALTVKGDTVAGILAFENAGACFGWSKLCTWCMA